MLVAMTDSFQKHDLSALEQDMLSTYADQIASLAQAAIEGGQNVEVELAALLEGAPDSVRTQAVQRFREMVSNMQEQMGDDFQLTPEQEKIMQMHAEREKAILAHMMSEETLDKMRKAMLANPAFYEQVMNLGEKLAKRGIFLDTQKQTITSSDVAAAVTPQNKQKDSEKSR